MAQRNSAVEVLQLKSEIEYLSKLIRKHNSTAVSHTKQYPYRKRVNHQAHSHVSVNKKWVASSNNNKTVEQKQPHTVSQSSSKPSRSVQCQQQLSSHSNCHSIDLMAGTTLTVPQRQKDSIHTAVSGRTSHNRMVIKPKPTTSQCSSRVVLKPAGCVKAESNQRHNSTVQNSDSVTDHSKSCRVASSSSSGGIPMRQQSRYSNAVTKVAKGDMNRDHNASTSTAIQKNSGGNRKRANANSSNSPLNRSVLQSSINSLGNATSSGLYRVVRYSENSGNVQRNRQSGTSSGLSQNKEEKSQRTVIAPASGSSLNTSKLSTEKYIQSSDVQPECRKYSADGFGATIQNPHSIHSPGVDPTEHMCITKSRYKLMRKSLKEETVSRAELKTFFPTEPKYKLSRTNVATTPTLHYPQTSKPGVSVKNARDKSKTIFSWEQTAKLTKANPSKYHWRRKLINSQCTGSVANSSTSLRLTTVKLSSRYKLVRKAIKISHKKNTKLNLSLNSRYKFMANRAPKRMAVGFSSLKLSPSRSCRKNKVWTKKYSLNRNLTGYHQARVRPVHNLSRSQFKFINGGFGGKLQGSKQRYPYHGLTKIDRRRSSERKSSTKYLRMRSRFVLNHKTSVSPETAKRIISKSLRTERIKDVASRMLQRSIYTAHLAKFKKNGKDNKKTYCIYFNRFGKCHRGNQCHYIHDPARVAICTRFLRGRCEVDNCPFSHSVSKEKMPVCQYFIKGICSRDNCPYLHSNVAKDAEVCGDFIQGFCVLGDQCKKKHILVCPDYQKHGSCSQGNNCKLRHIKHVARKRKHKEPAACSVASKIAKMDREDFDDVELPLGERQLPAYIPLDLTMDSVNTSQLSDGDSLLIHPRLSLGAECNEVIDGK